MKVRKILAIIMVMISLIVISNKAFAVKYYEIDYTDRSKIIEKAFLEWIETFKSEDIPEEKRILDYQIGAVGTSESNSNRIRATIEFTVTPFSKENTTWEYSEPEIRKWRGYDTIYEKKNICFLEMTNIDGEYKVDYIGETPKDYDKFLERFEEYKKTHPEIVENTQIQGKEMTNNQSNQEIEKVSNIILVACWVVLLIVLSFVSIKFLKRKK